MFCGKCGKQIPDTITFCPFCGAKVKPKMKNGDESTVSGPTNGHEGEQLSEHANNRQSNGQVSQPQSQNGGRVHNGQSDGQQPKEQFGGQFHEQLDDGIEQNEKPKKSKLPIILFVVLDAIVVAAIIIACVLLFGTSDEDGKTSHNEDYISSEEDENSGGKYTSSNTDDTSDTIEGTTSEGEEAADSSAEEDADDESAAEAAAAVAEALETAAEYAAGGDYVLALETISNAQALYGATDELDEAYDSYEQSYEDVVIAEAEALFENGDYDAALESVNTALGIVVDSARLTEYKSELSDHIESMEPVSITELTPMDANFSWNTGTPVDPFGNYYSDSTNWVVLGGSYNTYTGYEEYRIYGEYDTLTFNLAPYTDMGEDSWIYVQIFADDLLVYTSPQIVRKMDRFEVEVDLNGAEYLRILVKAGTSHASLILSDVLLQKSDGTDDSIDEDDEWVSLSQFTAINGGFDFDGDCDYPQDVSGSDYTWCQNYTIIPDGSYAEFRLYQEYDYITFNFSPYYHMIDGREVVIQIYADDEIIYTSPTITRMSDLQGATVSVSGAEYLKIVISANGYPYSDILLSDVFLHEAD